MYNRIIFNIVFFLLSACGAEIPITSPYFTEVTDGPRITYSDDLESIYDLPFPIDTLRNSSDDLQEQITIPFPITYQNQLEMIKKVNQLPGFGTNTPISIPFNEAIDIQELALRQSDLFETDNHAIYVVDCNPRSIDFAKPILLDFGFGSYPYEINDSASLLYEKTSRNNLFLNNDDLQDKNPVALENTRTVLDPSKITYDKSKNILFFRPLKPLLQNRKYAVIVTKRVKGLHGNSVQSPFEYIHHPEQYQDLVPIFDNLILKRLGITINDIAFAWSFTTQDITSFSQLYRKALYENDRLKALGYNAPARIQEYYVNNDKTNKLSITVDSFLSVLSDINHEEPFASEEQFTNIATLYRQYVDYIIAGTFLSPLIIDYTTREPHYDYQNSFIDYELIAIPFVLIIPKAKSDLAPPFKTTIMIHDFHQSMLNNLLEAPSLAKAGIAAFTFNLIGHKSNTLIDNDNHLYTLLSGKRNFVAPSNTETNNPSAKILTDHIFDKGYFQQSIIDVFQAMRLLKTFSSDYLIPYDLQNDGSPDILGDFNGDGAIDCGGHQSLSLWGIGFGGYLSSLISPYEPFALANVAISPAASIFDLMLRGQSETIQEHLLLPIAGPRIYLEKGDSDYHIYQYALDSHGVVHNQFIASIAEETMKQVTLVTVKNETTSSDYISNALSLSYPFAADSGNHLIIYFSDGENILHTVPFESLGYGQGLQFQTAAFRQALTLQSMIMDSVDPINVAKYLGGKPLYNQVHGDTKASSLILHAQGDFNIPTMSSFLLGRAAGLINYAYQDFQLWRSQNQWLIDFGVYENISEKTYFAMETQNKHPELYFCHYGTADRLMDIDRIFYNTPLPNIDVISNAPECGQPFAPEICSQCLHWPVFRLSHKYENKLMALRFLNGDLQNTHGINPVNTLGIDDPFNYIRYQAAYFIRTNGSSILDHTCLLNASCSFLQ